MPKKLLIILTVILLVLLAAFLFIPAPNKNGEPPKIETNSQNIRVFNLAAGQEVKSPLVVLGEARLWYFEASFPARLEDANENLIAQNPAQAKSDWMTEEFVPFEARFEFEKPLTKTGFVILEEDDPSGMNQNLEYIKIPVTFSDVTPGNGNTTEVKAYFLNDRLDPEITCTKVFPVTRIIPKTEAVARIALEELLKGLTLTDIQNGYQTSILSKEVKIQKLEIKNGVASVDFSAELEENSGGSCRVSAIRAQITETLKQFPTVTSVVISVNGRTEDILQP